MNTLKAEKRNMQTKAKKLRREGYVTGNVFGREIEGSIPVQMTQKEWQRKPDHVGFGRRADGCAGKRSRL